MGTVSTVSMIGMGVTLLIAIGLPIGLLIYARTKLGANIIWAGIGAVTFIVFALLLEQILHTIVFGLFGETMNGNTFIKAIYGGLAAGAFEEVGRFISMNLFKKKNLSKQNSFMYGVGHGGIEAIIIVGLTSISNLATSFMINAGMLETSLSVLDEQTREATLNQVSSLWTSHPSMFYFGGVERIFAIALQVCLSYIVYRAVKDGKIQLLFLAIGLHAFVDFVTVLVNAFAPAIVVELVLIVIVAIIAPLVYKKYSDEE